MKPFLTHMLALALATTSLTTLNTGVHAQSLSDITKRFGFPDGKKEEKSSDGTKIAGASAGCVVGGAVTYTITKTIEEKLKKEGVTGQEVEQLAFAAASFGCVVGGAVAAGVINNMDEKSKEEQEKAWAAAQMQTGPVAWNGPEGTGYSGTTELIAKETTPDGKECGTRKDFVLAAAGEAEAYTRVCKNESGTYEKVDV